MYVVSHHPFISINESHSNNHKHGAKNECARTDMKIWIEERVLFRERNRRATAVFNENKMRRKNIEINSSLEWCGYHIKLDTVSPRKCSSEDSKYIVDFEIESTLN